MDTTTTDVVLTKGERPEWKGDNKTPRRHEVASHYRVLLLVGDNLGDFVADDQTTIAQRAATVDRYRERWGSQWILVPNPMYGSWEGAAINYQRSLSGRRPATPQAQRSAHSSEPLKMPLTRKETRFENVPTLHALILSLSVYG